MTTKEEFVAQYGIDLERVKAAKRYPLLATMRMDIGSHPENYINFEQLFAAEMLKEQGPESVLDIGSNRYFVLGLLASYDVTSVDVRVRKASPSNETVIICDAKKLNIPDNHFDTVVSLCAIEHFGLGRYGDEIDLDGPDKAVREMVRVLKPGGRLIFSTHIHRNETFIRFNADWIFSRAHIESWLEDCTLVQERFYRDPPNGWVSYKGVNTELARWDVYCGCWQKSW